jgi:O-antigen ligase
MHLLWLSLAAYAILSTGSVGALAAFAIAVAIVVMRHVATVLGAVFVGMLALALFGATLIGRLSELSGSTTADNSLVWRFYQWQAALRLTPDLNLFGIGWQQVQERLPNKLPAHSAYVATYVELGLLGAAASLLGFAVMFASAARARETAALLVFVLVSSITDPIAFYPSTLTSIVLLLAASKSEADALKARAPLPRTAIRPRLITHGIQGDLGAHRS